MMLMLAKCRKLPVHIDDMPGWEPDVDCHCRNWDVTGTFNHTQRGIVKVPWGRLYPTDALQPNSNVVNIGAVVDSDFIDDMSFVPNAVAVNGVSCAMASAP